VNNIFYDVSIAKKYAQAFIHVFGSCITYAQVEKIESAQVFLSKHHRTLFFLHLPQFSEKIKKSMIEDLVDYLSLPQSFFNLFSLLVLSHRSFLIPSVLSFIGQLYRDRNNIVQFSVMSSHDLTEKQQKHINSFLNRSIDKHIVCKYLVKKSLIAGIALQSAEYRWEYSVRKQLNCLRLLAK
jgi:ATP synthase F1 delta subunit